MAQPSQPISPPSNPAFAGEDSGLEQTAAGIEAFGRGVSAHGTDIASKALGAGPEVKAREAKYHKTAAVGEFAGEALRSAIAVSLAGPMGLFANGALNVAGEYADAAYNHDPRLTREHVLKSAMTELLGASLGASAPWLMSGLKATGRWLAGKAVSGAAETLEPYAANYVKGGGKLNELADQALKDGVFSKTRAAAAQHAEGQMKLLDNQMGTFHSAVDSVSPTVPTKYAQAVQKLVGRKLDVELRQIETPAARSALKALKTDTRVSWMVDPQDATNRIPKVASKMAPSGMLRAESILRGAVHKATEANDGYTARVTGNALEQLKNINNNMMGELGLHAPAYRELQTSYAGAEALRDAAGTIGGGEAVKAGAGFVAKEAGAAALGAAGMPYAGGIAGAVVAGQELAAGAPALKAAFKVGPSLLRQGAYSAGSRMADIDKRAFAVWLGEQMKSSATAATDRVAALTAAGASKPAINKCVELLTAHAQTPDAVNRHVADFLHSAPLPLEHQDAGMHDVDYALSSARALLSTRVTAPNPLAPTASRRLPPAEVKRVQDYIHALIAPEHVLNHPTTNGLNAIRTHYPATYEAFGADLVRRLGPNAPINAPLRSLAEKHGLDNTHQTNGLILQHLYDQANQPQQAPSGNANVRKSEPNGSPRANNAATGPEQTQQRQQQGQ